jgi:hypothetical protein
MTAVAGETCVQPLYQRVLGACFERLPPALRNFHAGAAGGRARGLFRVTRGPGRLRGWLADRIGLPPAGERVPVLLDVRVEGDRERWRRQFDCHPALETVQWAQAGLLREAAGPVCFGFRLAFHGDELRFEPAGVWLAGLRLPRALLPRVAAAVTGRAAGWHVCVRVDVPLLGFLAQYEGEMVPE